ncbi:MAG TPA: acyl-CoA thioesterase [Polyangia bacterium]|nr:acyl-CoA thioesterase [Polyangia bacterium]
MLGSVHEYPVLIREQHLDTFGHVNNARYLDLFEEARWDLVTRNGYGLDEVMRRRVGPVILEVALKFQRELRNRQALVIKSWLDAYEGKVARMTQQMVDDQGRSCCQAQFVFGLFDLNARRLIAPTPEWLKAVGLSAADLATAPPAGRGTS